MLYMILTLFLFFQTQFGRDYSRSLCLGLCESPCHNKGLDHVSCLLDQTARMTWHLANERTTQFGMLLHRWLGYYRSLPPRGFWFISVTIVSIPKHVSIPHASRRERSRKVDSSTLYDIMD